MSPTQSYPGPRIGCYAEVSTRWGKCGVRASEGLGRALSRLAANALQHLDCLLAQGLYVTVHENSKGDEHFTQPDAAPKRSCYPYTYTSPV